MNKCMQALLYSLLVWGASPAQALQEQFSEEPWTWIYKKNFTSAEFGESKVPSTVTLDKADIPSFTQLVMSWNAWRPVAGYFSFWVQSRDAQTSDWSSWHKMMEWGSGVQRSYLSKHARGPHYVHVRLETGSRHADGFRIKVIAHEGALLSSMQTIFVVASDFTKFKPELIDHLALASVLINNVPQKAQLALNHERNTGLCGPTSCSMLLSYLMGIDVDPLDFAHNAYDSGLNAYGSWPFNIAHVFERAHGKLAAATMRLPSFSALHDRLQQGVPVIVSVRGFIHGAPKVYENGHFIVVIGWDAKRQQVICHDPACTRDADTLKKYPIKSFLAAWERSHRLAYVVEPLQNMEVS